MDQRIPDVLGEARSLLMARTGARAYVLSPGRGDFRLDSFNNALPDFPAKDGLAARSAGGLIYVDMRAAWYERAARAWNGMPVLSGWSDDPDAHLCAGLLRRDVFAAQADEADMPLVRRLMEAPAVLRGKSAQAKERLAALCAKELRRRNARALAERRSLYALRGCAAMLAVLIAQGIPL